MSSKFAFNGLFLLVVVTALIFRAVWLDLRPMHHDEANQAVKFGSLLEKGEYRYDPTEHHGPTLYYLTLPFAWIKAGTSFAAVDERTLRLVTVVFGVGMILLLLLLRGGCSLPAVFFSGIFAAVSPLLVFYNRFYIQETLLVFFLVGTVASGWKYWQQRTWGWAAAAGFFCGMMYATKETSLIVFAALVAAMALTFVFRAKPGPDELRPRKIAPVHVLIFLGTGFAVSFLFYSSFFKNPQGFLDSVLAFKIYFSRAGEAGFHAHPWPYYLKMLAFSRYGTGPTWSEALILVLASAGAAAAFMPAAAKESSPKFARFVFFYTLSAVVVYSSIPYKTPWNMLPFYVGMILLAGNGAAFLFRLSRKMVYQSLIFLMLGLGLFHLGSMCFRANFVYYADSRNPYVYAQTSPDFLNLVDRVRDLSRLHPDGKKMLIKVITHPDEAWPLPWYLRDFDHVGYWQEMEEAGDLSRAPLIISSVDKIERLELHFESDYLSEFYGLRPGVLLAVHIRKDLWERFLGVKALK
jgi:uncharacterized protein (TIGR03663 family)